MEEKNTYENFMDFLLGDQNETFDNGLSHPSVEFENNERKIADEIIENRLIEYHCCERFYGVEKLVCDNFKKLGSWISDRDGLNMLDTINYVLKNHTECENLNSKYQKPLEYLYKTKKIDDIIKKTDGTYYTKKLENCCLVKDENGEWDYVNKLNSNYSDTSELLTTLFLKGGQIDKLSKMNTVEVKNYLLTLKGKTMNKLLEKYFTIEDYKDYTYNTRNNTKVGDYVENLSKELLKNEGYTLLYEGGNGNFIDMIYGIDMIMEKDGNIYLVQVKSKSYIAKKSIMNERYRYIDIFIGESPDYNGINCYFREDGFNERFMGRDTMKKNIEYLKNLYK
jgi:Holliday junction resolvase-like predicted endonuclease